MDYKALTYVMLGDVKKSPGDSISNKELEEAGQTEDNIAQLVEGGAIGSEGDELHPDHRPIEFPEGFVVQDGGNGNA